jgi:hypothetical protein
MTEDMRFTAEMIQLTVSRRPILLRLFYGTVLALFLLSDGDLFTSDPGRIFGQGVSALGPMIGGIR